jgi:hypothetical protein
MTASEGGGRVMADKWAENALLLAMASRIAELENEYLTASEDGRRQLAADIKCCDELQAEMLKNFGRFNPSDEART